MVPENLEKIPSPEVRLSKSESELSTKKEKSAVEQTTEKKAEKIDKQAVAPASAVLAEEKIVSEEKQARAKEIDDVLAFGLNDIFLSLSPEKQEEFKQKGEETVAKINNLLDKAKVNLGKIVILIKKWLAIIPGVNRFFLEQEAKIKADKIIKLKKY